LFAGKSLDGDGDKLTREHQSSSYSNQTATVDCIERLQNKWFCATCRLKVLSDWWYVEHSSYVEIIYFLILSNTILWIVLVSLNDNEYRCQVMGVSKPLVSMD